MTRKWCFGILSFVFVAYLAIATCKARTMYIWSNEAWFASPALTLLQKGYLGTTILETKGTWMEGLERHTYWMPPIHLLFEAAWFRLFGFSLFTLRAVSILSGAATLFAWYGIVSLLSGNRNIALLSIGLAAADPRFLTFAALGRADMLCAALGALGLAAYLHLRNRSLRAAIVSANGLVAASCLTHPCGVLYAGGLLLLMMYHDRREIGWSAFALGALPYVLGLSAWGIYILQAPSEFVRQFTGNISGIASEFTNATRWSGLSAPVIALKREYFLRYGSAFGWYGPAPADRIQLFAFLFYTLAVLGCLLTGSIRKHSGYRVLLWIGVWDFLMLGLFDGLKGSAYLVHTLPLCAALLAILLQHLWELQGIRWAIGAAMVVFGAVQLGAAARYLLYQPVRQDYKQVAEILLRSPPPLQVIAGGEFAFALGFDSGMIDDFRLGYFSGRRPSFIVVNTIYKGWFERSAITDPQIHTYMTELLRNQYRLALYSTNYTLYERITH